MAKEVKKVRYVKLGEAAAEGSFFDPQLNLRLVPGNMEILPNNFRGSKRTVRALAGGHLEYVDSEEVQAFLDAQDTQDNEDDDDDDEVTAAMLKKYNKEKLTAFIIDNDEEADESELASMDKATLLAEALGLI